MGKVIFPRSVTRFGENRFPVSSLLETYRDTAAYVLLGEPGAGKSTAFRQESEFSGGRYVAARHFVIEGGGADWRGETLFIDGLDEIGADLGYSVLRQVQRKLIELGRPAFRLSCREADWLGASDADDLARNALDGRILTLHLNPLDEEEIKLILRENLGVADADDFLLEASRRGLDDLLRNPQTLEFIAEAVGEMWPDSREETYSLACSQLLREENRAHRDVRRVRPRNEQELLTAAGCLNAMLLLAGLEGVALDAGSADRNHVALEKVGIEKPELLFAVIKTRLFINSDDSERRRPIHRSVAEFLAARYLAGKIEQEDLPLGRVVALMCGRDGGVVPQLRGLHAWLAVHCHEGRAELIERDPLGVILYGDASGFSASDKCHILEALSREAKGYAGFRFQDWTAHPFGALATLDMEANFRALLISSDRSEAHQALLECVLDAMVHGQAMSALCDEVEQVVRDASYGLFGLRRTALAVLLRNKDTEPARLTKLMADIQAARIEDPDDDLLGKLLSEMYPALIAPEKVFDFLHPCRRDSYIGPYHMFWHHDLARLTPGDKVPLLLDRLAEIRPFRDESYQRHVIDSPVGELLARGIEEYGAVVAVERLHTWLDIGRDEHGSNRLDREHSERIAAWFVLHSDHYKAVLKYAIARCSRQEHVRVCLWDSARSLYGAQAPDDLGQWFLALAEDTKDEETARYCFERALITLIPRESWENAALEAMEDWVEQHPRFIPWLDQYLTDSLPDWRQKDAARNKNYDAKNQERKVGWLSFFRDHTADLRQNRAHPKILHDLAWAYFGHYIEARGEEPHARLREFLDGDAELIDVALAGLRGALTREDVPSVEEIVRLDIEGRYHYIRTAYLAGAEEISAAEPARILDLDEDILQRLVAFRLTYNADRTPDWFICLVAHRPELVAEVLKIYAIPYFRHGKRNLPLSWVLANDDSYTAVARHAVPDLLESFPLRARKDQLSDLEELLKAGLRHLDRAAMARLVETRLSKDSLDAAQKTYWLGAGLALDPTKYEAPLTAHLGRSQVRTRHLAAFFHDRWEDWTQKLDLSVSALALLIERLGPGCAAERPEGAHWVSPVMHTAELVRNLIQRLGAMPGPDAAATLEKLVSKPALRQWYAALKDAKERQRINWRRTEFRHESVEAVQETLANRRPASHSDLAAVVMEHLRDIAHRVRHGATDSYRDFWNLDRHGRCERPRHENDCRNTLLTWLNERLGRLGIDAQREVSYAEEKRADIRVWYGGTGHSINVPIEIKRDSHRDVWKAMHEQLIPRYTRDPGADGYGIYLVFWFGGEKMPTAPDGGRKPKTARELEERLICSLAPVDRYRIQVCVIDCACPAA